MLSLNNGNDSPYKSHKSAGKPLLCHKILATKSLLPLSQIKLDFIPRCLCLHLLLLMQAANAICGVSNDEDTNVLMLFQDW